MLCQINVALVVSIIALVVSIAGWIVNDWLARRRDMEIAETAKRRDREAQVNEAKIKFKLCVTLMSANIPYRDIDDFYTRTKPGFKSEVFKFKLFLSAGEAGALEALWTRYDKIIPHAELSNEKETTANNNFEKRFENSEAKKPSGILSDFYEDFFKIAS